MPNWCMNEIILTGPRDVIDEIAETKLELAKLVPWPADMAGFQKVTPIPKAEKKARAELTKKYGVDNLYDWCIQNWGTKWDIGARVVEPEEVPGLPGKQKGKQAPLFEIQTEFDSAWTPPVKAMETIFNRYKDRGLTIWMEYFEPGCKFLGTVTGTRDGKFEDEYREYETAADLEDAVRELEHGLAESEVDYLREQEAEEAEEAPEDPKAAPVKAKSVKTAKPAKKTPKKTEKISVTAKKVPLKAAKSAKPVKAKSPAKKAPAKVTVKRAPKKSV